MVGVSVFLAVLVWAVFGQTRHYEFVNFDDNAYVYDNPQVDRGLTWPGVVWVFTHAHGGNWHPLTGISHMLDCQVYGLNPGGHHLTNVLLHAVTAILLFLGLRNLTGYLWRSALVAAVFAVHPLRVESVAWVAERKDVLSGVFFMLTIGAYAAYARRPWSPARYGLVVLLLALGLMAKPMLVTLPLVLLLLDYWPLNRWRTGIGQPPVFRLGRWWVPRRLVLEKLPWLGLAVASGIATVLAQTGAIRSFDQISLPWRVHNALIAGVTYIGQMFWPSGLAVLYPYRVNGGPAWEMWSAMVLLLGLSAGVCVWRKTRPYLLVGWCWYLIMLGPVIGILQVGVQAHADRYTYLPQIGLYLALTWLAAERCAGWRHRRWLLGGGSAVLLAVLTGGARAQTACWRNSESLWRHALANTPHNLIAHINLGQYLFQTGRLEEAVAQYQTALKLKPDNLEARNNLGRLLLQEGRVDEAIGYFQTVLQTYPDFAEAQSNLGDALVQKGRLAEGITRYEKALLINPDYVVALNNLVWVLAAGPEAALRNGNLAVVLGRRASQLKFDNDPLVLGGLAAACAEAGRFPEAVAAAQRAVHLADTQGKTALAESLRAELQLYQAGHPFHLN